MGWISLASGKVMFGAMLAARLWRGRRYPFRDKVVVITGGSRGLGLELARRWAAEGAHVALCGRGRPSVQHAVDELRLEGHDVLGVACDVRRREDVDAFVDTVVKRWGGIDVLVNNAGVIQAGPSTCMTLDDFRDAIETHFWGPLYAVMAALPTMRARGGGRIVNISSIGGVVSMPHLLPYSASKFALTGLSAGLHTELAQENIAVTTVFPGLMRTGSPRNAWFKGQHRAEYAWFSIADSTPGLTMGSSRAARLIVEACRHGDAELVLTWAAKSLAKARGLFPTVTAAALRQANRILPGAGHVNGRAMRGSESTSPWSPSWWTTLTQRAERRNHQLENGVNAPT